MKHHIAYRYYDEDAQKMWGWEQVQKIDQWWLRDNVMPSTGLPSRSGSLVYEGDIVRVFDTERYCICNEWDDCEGIEDPLDKRSAEHKNHGEHKHESPVDCGKYVCRQEVKWSSGGYFCDEDTGDFCPPLGAEEIELEVIGNRYENPEMLKAL